MAKVLFITDIQKDGTITKASLEALTAATELSEALSAELNIGLFGEKVQEVAKSFPQKHLKSKVIILKHWLKALNLYLKVIELN